MTTFAVSFAVPALAPTDVREMLKIPSTLLSDDLQTLILPASGVEVVVSPSTRLGRPGASEDVGVLSPLVQAARPTSATAANCVNLSIDGVVIPFLMGKRTHDRARGVLRSVSVGYGNSHTLLSLTLEALLEAPRV